MYKQPSVGSAVNRLNSVVTDSLNQAITYTCTRQSKFPGRFSVILKYYINKKNHLFRRYKEPNMIHIILPSHIFVRLQKLPVSPISSGG